jgi:hypothetical protein
MYLITIGIVVIGSRSKGACLLISKTEKITIKYLKMKLKK